MQASEVSNSKKNKFQIPKKNGTGHPDCYGDGELNPKRMNYFDASIRGIKISNKTNSKFQKKQNGASRLLSGREIKPEKIKTSYKIS